MVIRAEIVDYIEQSILPRYASFDKAHNIDHAQTVIGESLELSDHYPELDKEMVYIIAAFHDLGLCDCRERHHIVSGEILLSDKFIASLFSTEQITTMREAIEDHRASSKREPRSIYGAIVAEADRVISCEITLRRTVQYGLKQNPEASKEQHFARFNEHLQEKYAQGGYLKLYIPHSNNATRLSELRTLINDKVALRREFDSIFAEETLP